METASVDTSRESTSASAVAAVKADPIFDRRQPRVCDCGRREGEIVQIDGELQKLVVNRAYVDKDRDGEPLLRYLCRICIQGGAKAMKVYDAVKLHAALHKQWEARQAAKIAAIEAARKRRAEERATECAAIEAELAAVIAGTATKPFVSCEEKDGIWRCVRPGCSCQKALRGQPKPVRAVAVIGGEIRRVCTAVAGAIFSLQSHGVREVAVWGFGLPGDEDPGKRSLEEAEAKCRKHMGWLKFRATADRRNQGKAKRAEPAPTHATYLPAGPRVLPTQIQKGESRASERARERNDRYAAALRLGVSFEDAGLVNPDRPVREVGMTPAELIRLNGRLEAAATPKKPKKGGGKDGGKGKRH
jgi:hypothetical protein